MALARKPKEPATIETAVEAIISKGGSVATNGYKPQTKVKKHSVVVHIPAEWVEEIDMALNSRRVKTSRHTWLLEAITEKLDREKE